MRLRISYLFPVFLTSMVILSSCGSRKNASSTTGWDYNNPDNGGFEYNDGYFEQETGPGLVLIEGGTFTMGSTEQDVLYDWNNIPRRLTVPSFYIDQTEIRNSDYREYLYWLKRVFVDYVYNLSLFFKHYISLFSYRYY